MLSFLLPSSVSVWEWKAQWIFYLAQKRQQTPSPRKTLDIVWLLESKRRFKLFSADDNCFVTVSHFCSPAAIFLLSINRHIYLPSHTIYIHVLAICLLFNVLSTLSYTCFRFCYQLFQPKFCPSVSIFLRFFSLSISFFSLSSSLFLFNQFTFSKQGFFPLK